MAAKISELIHRDNPLAEDLTVLANLAATENYKLRLDFLRFGLDSININEQIEVVDEHTVLFGRASEDVLTSEAGWRISQVTSNGVDFTDLYPSGDRSFSFVWDDRLSYSYS